MTGGNTSVDPRRSGSLGRELAVLAQPIPRSPHRLAGPDARPASILRGLSQQQRHFLAALARFPLLDGAWADDVATVAEKIFGSRVPRDEGCRNVLGACAASSLITVSSRTRGGIRSRPHVRPTEKFRSRVSLPLLRAHPSCVARRLRSLLWSTHPWPFVGTGYRRGRPSGMGADTLSLYLMFLLDLRFAGWRRATGASIDQSLHLFAGNDALFFSRWQILCRVGHLGVDDVAAAYGLGLHFGSNVLVLASTGSLMPQACCFVRSVEQSTSVQVVQLGGQRLCGVKASPAAIVRHLLQRNPTLLDFAPKPSGHRGCASNAGAPPITLG